MFWVRQVRKLSAGRCELLVMSDTWLGVPSTVSVARRSGRDVVAIGLRYAGTSAHPGCISGGTALPCRSGTAQWPPTDRL